MAFSLPMRLPDRLVGTRLAPRWIAAHLNGVADGDVDAFCNALDACGRFDAETVEAGRVLVLQKRGLPVEARKGEG